MANSKIRPRLNMKRVLIALLIVYIILGFISYGLGNLVGLIFKTRHKNSYADNQSAIQVDVNANVTTEPPEDTLTVCIDAGHGGKDAGSLSTISDRYEKDDNIAIALAIESELEKQGIEVVMTRDDDTFIPLPERCSIANKADVDYFVSLHRNSSDDGSGIEIWVSKKKPAEDISLANNIMNGLIGVGVQKNRGVHFGYVDQPDSDYQVNRETDMPSCLIEMGFMDDKQDNLLFDQNLKEYAIAISDAIIMTWEQYKDSNNSTAVSSSETTIPTSIVTDITDTP